jgi:hypothetical protein
MSEIDDGPLREAAKRCKVWLDDESEAPQDPVDFIYDLMEWVEEVADGVLAKAAERDR